MKKMYFMMAAFAGMLAACTNDADPVQEAAEVAKNTPQVTQQVPIEFGAYVNRATTRAGQPGELTLGNADANEASRTGLSKGFGVIAYYTDDDLYSPIYQPNFMYNTKIYSTAASTWAYSPVRYWPNETGANATSDGVDRLSFFAYAPYVEVTPETGIVTEVGGDTWGIVGLTRNAAVGDPFVKYNVSLDPDKQVDFCWGVAPNYTLPSVEGGNNTISEGEPLLNLLKTNTTGKVQFDFKHALAKLNVQIDAFVDGIDATNALADKTKIYVRKVTFEGFVTQGSFNLNAKAANPAWYDMAGSSYINGGSVTIYDGRTDGREAVSPADSEQPQGLNSTIIQDEKYYTTYPTTPNGSVKPGVTNTAVNLFTEPETGTTDEKKASPIYVIPSGQPLKVTIVYDVETDTEELPTYLSDGETHGTSVQNTITKTIKTSGSEDIKLTAGKQYTIKLHLGMNSVKFDATVSSWATPAVEGSADLPANVTPAP